MEVAVGMSETKREMDSDDSIEAEVPQEMVALLTPPEPAEVGQLQALPMHRQAVRCNTMLVAVSLMHMDVDGCSRAVCRQGDDAQLNGSNGAHVDVKSKTTA